MGIACYNSIGLFSDLVICALQRVKIRVVIYIWIRRYSLFGVLLL